MDSDWLEVIDWDSRVVRWCPRPETNTPTTLQSIANSGPASGLMLAIHGVVPEPRTATGSAPDAVDAVQLIAN